MDVSLSTDIPSSSNKLVGMLICRPTFSVYCISVFFLFMEGGLKIFERNVYINRKYVVKRCLIGQQCVQNNYSFEKEGTRDDNILLKSTGAKTSGTNVIMCK